MVQYLSQASSNRLLVLFLDLNSQIRKEEENGEKTALERGTPNCGAFSATTGSGQNSDRRKHVLYASRMLHGRERSRGPAPGSGNQACKRAYGASNSRSHSYTQGQSNGDSQAYTNSDKHASPAATARRASLGPTGRASIFSAYFRAYRHTSCRPGANSNGYAHGDCSGCSMLRCNRNRCHIPSVLPRTERHLLPVQGRQRRNSQARRPYKPRSCGCQLEGCGALIQARERGQVLFPQPGKQLGR